jgi:uncharacterized protein (TIGR02421 family)
MRELTKILRINAISESDIKLDILSRKISFHDVNPNNADKEMKKFFKNPNYNPQFSYDSSNEDLDLLEAKIKAIKTDRSVPGMILSEIKSAQIDKINLIRNRKNADKFTKASIKIYDAPDKKLLESARKLLKLKAAKDIKLYSSKEVMNKFRFAFLEYGFPWTVVEKNMVANAAVNCSSKTLMIKKGARFSKKFVKRLIVHEIGTHAMRNENGAMQPYKFFERGFPDYLMTEEGLAVINEELNNCLDSYTLKVYAGRVIAVDYALNGSFSETYLELRKHFDKKTAWRLTLRAKRGLSDTKLPGACTKDLCYLKGYLEIKKYLKDGGDINKLYYGKIGLSEVGIIEKMPGLINPKFLPMFRHTNYLIQHFSSILKTIIFFDIEPGISFINKRIIKTLR